MVFFNYATMELTAKIVYYGPGLCGKTTNLQYIYRKTSPQTRGEMVSLATETDRTLFFDLLPIKLGNIGGFKTRFQLYTVPGQVFYNSTRKLVLRGVDAVVFVADSQAPLLEANLESLENLEENLREHNLDLDSLPWIIQYNKRDLPNILPVAELNRHLNKHGVPCFESVATVGKGVLATLKEISKLTLKHIRRKVGEASPTERERRPVSTIGAARTRRPAPPREEEVEFDIHGGSEVSEAGKVAVPGLEPKPQESTRKRPAPVAEQPKVVAPGVSAPSRPGPSATVDIPLKEAASPEKIAESEILEKILVQKVRVPIKMSELNGHKKIRLKLKLEVECVVLEPPT